MQPLPHHYTVSADGDAAGDLSVEAEGPPSLAIAPPLEFDGPGDHWSPETLLCAAVASCFILTFRAIARASKFTWQRLECSVVGRLERVEGVTRFSSMQMRIMLVVPPMADATLAGRLLEKAEHGCLVSNSLTSERSLEFTIRRGE